jgi:hypothetical protein
VEKDPIFHQETQKDMKNTQKSRQIAVDQEFILSATEKR